MKNFLQQNKLLIQHISILFISILSAYIFFQYLFTLKSLYIYTRYFGHIHPPLPSSTSP